MNASNILKVMLAFAVGLALVAFAYFTLGRPFMVAANGGPPVMRSYRVHGDHADEVRVALQSALQGDDDKRVLGRVTLAPNGQLIVTAPASIQRGVETLMNDVMVGAPSPAPTVKLEVWFVRGGGEAVAGEPQLQEVQPALDAIRETQGVASFQLIEKLTLHSRAGHRGRVQGPRAHMAAEPTVRRDGEDASAVSTNIQLGVSRVGAQLNADVELQPGELLVLGQSAYAERNAATAPPQTLYYIVRATL